MPRTTLNLDPTVIAQLKQRSKQERKPLGRVASELLARGLEGDAESTPSPFNWKSRDLGSPRVDLEDKEALRSYLDDERHG